MCWQGSHRNPIKNFHDFSMINNDTDSNCTTPSINAEYSNNSLLEDHACILQKLKLETTSSQKTSCWTHKCPIASFLAAGGFVILFHEIPWFFHDYSVFFSNSMIFPCMELLVIFQVFHDFQSLWEPCVEKNRDLSSTLSDPFFRSHFWHHCCTDGTQHGCCHIKSFKWTLTWSFRWCLILKARPQCSQT